MALIKPRLTDFHNIHIGQEALDFAIPLLDDDIPLYVDPFLLWKSPSQQDVALHTVILSAFNGIGRMAIQDESKAAKILVAISECTEAGLGQAINKNGRRISESKAREILSLFKSIPEIQAHGLKHIETIQVLIEGIGKDRISDLSCSLLKSFLIDFTQDQCHKIGIPLEAVTLNDMFDFNQGNLTSEQTKLPVNPENKQPLLLIPKRWLRFSPWISYDNFFDGGYCKLPIGTIPDKASRPEVLNFNRQNYGVIQEFITSREKTAADCANDPLFKQIPITAAKTKLKAIRALKSGIGDGADRKYEAHIEQLFASLFYPHLDFAKGQSRTDSGSHIRDLVFYNNQSDPFLSEINEKYGSSQIVFEIKNVREIERDHVNQLNRYLTDSLGRFGVFVTRNPVPKKIERNLVDLWSSQRKCIVVLTDEDVSTMVAVFDTKQRLPIEVLKRAYVEFARKLPS